MYEESHVSVMNKQSQFCELVYNTLSVKNMTIYSAVVAIREKAECCRFRRNH